METVTFYSYKGGSGRSLLLANAARYLALAGKNVIALDLDFEAPGLHYKLHIGRPGERTSDVVPEHGIVDYLLASRTEKSAPSPAEYLTDVPLPQSTAGQLRLMPAGSAPSAQYWRNLTSLLRAEARADEQEGVPALLELKTRLEEDAHADTLLIDARTGITEFGGIATTILADKVVCLVLDNQENLTGARAVMRSFRRAARLHGQRSIEVVPVLSRVPEPDERTIRRVLDFLNEEQPGEPHLSFDHLFILRDDRDLAARERLYFGEAEGPIPLEEKPDVPGIKGLGIPVVRPDVRTGLGRDYADLLEALFPGQSTTSKRGRRAALRRQQAVRAMRDWLTDDDEPRRHRRIGPRAFRNEEIDEGVSLDKHGIPYADLVGYSPDGNPLLAALFSKDLDPSEVWRNDWLYPGTGPRCVFLFRLNDEGRLERRAFTRAQGKFTERSDDFHTDHHSREWWLRFPDTYRALPDPGEQSISSLLASVQGGDDTFIGLLVQEWQHASFLTLHGGTPFRPDVACQIVDGLAAVKDGETATRLLWYTAPDPFERTDHGFHDEAGLEELTTRNLHAPLFWRLPAAAKIAYWQHGRDRSTTAGIEMLARDILGLRFDQDQDLREEVERLIEATGGESSTDDEGVDSRELRYMWDLFSARELTFEVSENPPPELVRRVLVGTIVLHEGPRARTWEEAESRAQVALRSDATLSRLLRDRSGRFSMITTNLLGHYDAGRATVTIYSPLVEFAARQTRVPIADLENVVFLHETVHAISHLGRDLDGREWQEFALPSSRDLAFRPSALHEGIAQYFTFRMIERLGDGGMMKAFDSLSDHQPDEYRVWRRLRSTPMEQMRAALLRARSSLHEALWPLPGD